MGDKKKKSERKKEPYWSLIIWFIAVILIWYGSILFLNNYTNCWSTRGTIGDSFGGVNSLFSGLAFAGIIYTIFLQRKELELTRKELTRSAEAQEKSEQQLKEQADSMKQSAKLTALNSLLQAYTESADYWFKATQAPTYTTSQSEKNNAAFRDYSKKKKDCIDEIAQILEQSKKEDE